MLLDETGGERLEGLVEEVVLALEEGNSRMSVKKVRNWMLHERWTHITDGELERIKLNIDVLDVEDARAVLGIGRDELNGDSQALSAEEDISKTRVLDLGEAVLLVEVESHIAHVGLDLRERESEVVVVLVGDGLVWRELEEVVRF